MATAEDRSNERVPIPPTEVQVRFLFKDGTKWVTKGLVSPVDLADLIEYTCLVLELP